MPGCERFGDRREWKSAMYHLPDYGSSAVGDCGGLGGVGEDSRNCLMLLDESGASRNPWSAMECSVVAGDLGESLTFVRDPAIPHDDGSKFFDGGSSRLSGLGDCSLMMAPDTQGDPLGPLILHSGSTRDGMPESPIVTVTGAAGATRQIPESSFVERQHEVKPAPTPTTATKHPSAARPGHHAERGHYASSSSNNAGSNRAAAAPAESAAALAPAAQAPKPQPVAKPVAPPTASMWTQEENDVFFEGLAKHRRDFERIYEDLKVTAAPSRTVVFPLGSPCPGCAPSFLVFHPSSTCIC